MLTAGPTVLADHDGSIVELATARPELVPADEALGALGRPRELARAVLLVADDPTPGSRRRALRLLEAAAREVRRLRPR